MARKVLFFIFIDWRNYINWRIHGFADLRIITNNYNYNSQIRQLDNPLTKTQMSRLPETFAMRLHFLQIIPLPASWHF